MSKSRTNPGPIPNRWLHCPRKANSLVVGKFMALKTPLSSDFNSQVPNECRFYPKMLFDICKAKKIKFGLWVDLTYTKRFYDPAEIEEQGCKYVKLQCRGHGETPTEEQTTLFIELVHNFIIKNPLESIAVHCTHGFNRTGFLIVSYLVEKMDFSLDVALQNFADARPTGIYKADYLEELYRRYDDVEDAPPAPRLPDWCIESDDRNVQSERDKCLASTSSISNEANNTNTSSKNKRQPATEFMVGVPGVRYFDEQPKAHNLQKKVQVMCGWKSKGFPGCQPVSMNRENIKFLQDKPYRVSWKADGTRYMMLIDGEDEVYFFDRNHTVFKVTGLRFVHRGDLRRHLVNTLLDGEMVIDKFQGRDFPRYLAYDIIRFENREVGKEPFYPTRLEVLEKEIINPRHLAMENDLINKRKEPFSVRKKEFWPITEAAGLLSEKFIKALSHEPDGLIFQPSDEPYVAGRCDHVLKWKPLELNSIDFKLKIVKEGGMGKVPQKVGYLHVLQYDPPAAKMNYTKTLKDLDNKIIECKFEDQQWKFMRERTDKTHPNSYNTALAVFDTIRHPVTKDYLLNYIKENRYNDDSEIMPPPSKKVRR